MKITWIATFLLVLNSWATSAQSDSRETLQWAEEQANIIDAALHSAKVSQEPMDLMFRLMDCYIRFDAVSMAGLYCTEARAAAEIGKNVCDVVNYRLEKDLNSIILRAIEARTQAEKMRRAIRFCSEEASKLASYAAFYPVETIRKDVEMVLLDLSDGMASEDFHILSQKVEHAIHTLHEVEHLAFTLKNCRSTYLLAREAVSSCEKVLFARNWSEVTQAVGQAKEKIMMMKNETCL